ncbi:DNA polymerase III subunit gamma/tau, partial [Campylobacter coli]|nr:DNA polymerase III subunit gamma/tau [Campylobacter coli]
KFILATTDPLKLPATVLSRTQHFRFKQIPQNEILNHLKEILNKENVNFEEEALKFVARSGNGSLRDTLTLLDQAIIFCQNDISTSKITDMLGFLDPAKIKEFYHAILTKNKDRVFVFLEELKDYEASSVIDEMLFYLKESFFAKSSEFSTLIYER